MLLILIAFILGLPLLRNPAVSFLQDNVLDVFSDLIEVKVRLLSENVLAGYIVTECKCSRIT